MFSYILYKIRYLKDAIRGGLKVEELLKIVSEFRQAIDKAMSKGEFEEDICFNNFPIGCCGDTADLLGQYLLTHGIKTKYVCGHYGEDESNELSHAWLLLDDDIIIDITGDQFKENPVFNYSTPLYIGPCDEFHAMFKVEPIRDIRAVTYVSELGPFCAPRLGGLYAKIIKYI